MPEGRQSPPPERQTGAQQQAPPSDGKGIDNADNKEQNMKSQVENLESNPKGAMDNQLEAKFSKSEGNSIGS